MAESEGNICSFDKYRDKDYNEVGNDTVKNAKVVAVLVSAEWWPGCKPFKQKLKAAYQEINGGDKGGDLEVIYLSGDKNEDTFKGALKEKCFLTVTNYDDHEALIGKVGIDGYPYLQALDNTGKVIQQDMFNDLNAKGAGAFKALIEK